MEKMLSFHVKFVQTDRWADGQMDRLTMVKQYAPDLSIRGHKKTDSIILRYRRLISNDINQRVRLAVAALVKSTVINEQANMVAGTC